MRDLNAAVCARLSASTSRLAASRLHVATASQQMNTRSRYFQKFWKARSPLYRGRFLLSKSANTHFVVLVFRDQQDLHISAPLSIQKISSKRWAFYVNGCWKAPALARGHSLFLEKDDVFLFFANVCDLSFLFEILRFFFRIESGEHLTEFRG